MDTTRNSARVVAFDAAMSKALQQLRVNRPAAALRTLRIAHVLGQQDFWRHLNVHWQMLRAACGLRDGGEALGQVLRLLLVPLGHLSGRLPKGNPGTAEVSAFAPRAISPRLQRLLDDRHAATDALWDVKN
jgi:hypothetical protein